MKIYIKPQQTICKHDIPFIQKLNPIYALIYLCFSLYTLLYNKWITKSINSLLQTIYTLKPCIFALYLLTSVTTDVWCVKPLLNT